MTLILQKAVVYFAYFLETVIFIRVIASWLPIGRDNGIIKILYVLTEPLLAPIRAALRKSPLGGPGMMLDFSPIIAYAVIEFGKTILVTLIMQIAARF